MFRPVLEGALGRSPRWKGGRPPFDPVLKVRMLVLQSLHGLSLEQTEFLVRDRLSWMRFCRLGPEDRVPDANTLWDFREALIAAGALEELFARLDRAITAAGYLPRGGQIVDASLVAAPRQRTTDGEKAQIKEGKIRRRDLAGQTRQGAPEGYRRSLDRQILQGEGPRRRYEAAFAVVARTDGATMAHHRHPRLRLQVPCLDRQDAWIDPSPDRHRCRPA